MWRGLVPHPDVFWPGPALEQVERFIPSENREWAQGSTTPGDKCVHRWINERAWRLDRAAWAVAEFLM
eukprot:4351935-Lingulodinium_polyedra.AAC.1